MCTKMCLLGFGRVGRRKSVIPLEFIGKIACSSALAKASDIEGSSTTRHDGRKWIMRDEYFELVERMKASR